jgi:tetratricopeptide (TPR) repeat protein
MANEPLTTNHAPRPRVRRWLAAALVLGGLAAGWYWWWREREPPPVPPEVPAVIQDAEVIEGIDRAREEVLREPSSARSWGRLGMVFHANGCPEEAQACYEQARRADPQDYHWPYYLGVLQMTNESAAAIDSLRQAVELAGDEGLEIRLTLADVLLENNHPGEAEACYREVLHRQSNNQSAQLGLGKAALARQDDVGSMPFLEAAATAPETRKTACSLLAMVQLRRGKPEAAARAQAQARLLPPDEARAQPLLLQVKSHATGKSNRLAYIDQLHQQGNYQEALRLAQDLSTQYPDDPWVSWAVTREQFFTKDLAGARRGLVEATRKWPDMVRAHFYLGQLLLTEAQRQATKGTGGRSAQGTFRAAAECFERVTKLKADYAEAFYALGLCRQGAGDRGRAEQALRTALGQEPSYVDAHTALADLLLTQGATAEALVHIRYALALSLSPDPRPLRLLARVVGRGLLG